MGFEDWKSKYKEVLRQCRWNVSWCCVYVFTMVCTCACWCTYTCMYVCGDQRPRSGGSLTLHLTLEDGAVHWSELIDFGQACKLQGAACLCLPRAWEITHVVLHMGVWDLNSVFLFAQQKLYQLSWLFSLERFLTLFLGAPQEVMAGTPATRRHNPKAAGADDPLSFPALPPWDLSPSYLLRSEQSPWPLPTALLWWLWRSDSCGTWGDWCLTGSDNVLPRAQRPSAKGNPALTFLGVPSPEGLQVNTAQR